MTSAKANGSTLKPSKARENLAYALGEHRVALSGLRPKELEEILNRQLRMPLERLRELIGFVELKELLRRQGDTPLEVGEDVNLQTRGFTSENPLTLKSQLMRVCRGALSYKPTYRRHESGEETQDWKVFDGWGKSGYLYQCEESLLLLRRLPDRASWNECYLVQMRYKFIKILNKQQWRVAEIFAQPVPIVGFCKHFGREAPSVARDFLWELNSIFSRTADHFEGKARQIRYECFPRERLSGSIME